MHLLLGHLVVSLLSGLSPVIQMSHWVPTLATLLFLWLGWDTTNPNRRFADPERSQRSVTLSDR